MNRSLILSEMRLLRGQARMRAWTREWKIVFEPSLLIGSERRRCWLNGRRLPQCSVEVDYFSEMYGSTNYQVKPYCKLEPEDLG